MQHKDDVAADVVASAPPKETFPPAKPIASVIPPTVTPPVQKPLPVAPPPKPIAPIEKPPLPPAPPAVDVEREKILARLREKVSAKPIAPVVVEKPVPPRPQIQPKAAAVVPPPPVPTPKPGHIGNPSSNVVPIPSHDPSYRSSLKFAQAPHIPAHIEPAVPPVRVAPPPLPRKIVADAPAPLHTYKTDFADRIDTKAASNFSVLAAEQDARRGEPQPAAKPKSVIPTLLMSGLLVVVGAVGVYAAYSFATRTPVLPLAATVPSLVFADEYKELTGTGDTLMEELAATAREPLVSGNVLVTYVTSATTTPKGVFAQPLPGGALIANLQLPAPDILLRNLELASTVGIISAGEEIRPFFVLRVSSYERTFAGMLDWEDTIERDLDRLYPRYPDPSPPANATSTPELDTPLPVAVPEAPEFVNAIVANHDVRVLRDSFGRSILLYGYRDKATLIIARDEAAFRELVGRLVR